MAIKRSKDIVDNLLETVYHNHIVTVHSYEQELIEIMIDLDCTISKALDIDFDIHGLDKTSVIDLVDYLENRLNGELYKVSILMQIYTHQMQDFKLKPL